MSFRKIFHYCPGIILHLPLTSLVYCLLMSLPHPFPPPLSPPPSFPPSLSPLSPSLPGGLIPLHNACSFGHTEVVSILVKHGTDPNARDNWNFTPLHEAAIKGKVDVCIGKKFFFWSGICTTMYTTMCTAVLLIELFNRLSDHA